MEHTITQLGVQKRNPQRINVYLDGDYAFGLARIVAAWLKIGQVLSDDQILQLQKEDQYESAYQRSLKFLSYRPRTQSEIRQNLKEHEIPDDVTEQVIERLVELGMLNDSAFTQTWIENRSAFRPRSRRALSHELRQRGVDPQIIEQSLETLDEETLAYQAASKQARRYKDLDYQLFRQKMFGFLARRGFNYEVSAPTVTKIWNELQNNDMDNGEEVDK